MAADEPRALRFRPFVVKRAMEDVAIPMQPEIVARAGRVRDVRTSTYYDAVNALTDPDDLGAIAHRTFQPRVPSHGSQELGVAPCTGKRSPRTVATTSRRNAGG